MVTSLRVRPSSSSLLAGHRRRAEGRRFQREPRPTPKPRRFTARPALATQDPCKSPSPSGAGVSVPAAGAGTAPRRPRTGRHGSLQRQLATPTPIRGQADGSDKKRGGSGQRGCWKLSQHSCSRCAGAASYARMLCLSPSNYEPSAESLLNADAPRRKATCLYRNHHVPGFHAKFVCFFALFFFPMNGRFVTLH